MILLKQIKITNFLSHKDTEIVFNTEEKILIDGDSGAGKSTIVDALVWGLYGVGRSENKSLVFKGEEKATVEIVLEDTNTGRLSVIVRSTTNKGKHTLNLLARKGKKEEMSNLTGIKDIQNYIEKELIGASYLLFVNSVVHTQDGNELFVTQSALKRKELLLEIVNANDFDDNYELAKKKINELEIEENTLKTTILEKNAFISSIKERTAGKESIKTNIKDLKASIKETKSSIDEKEKKYEEVRDNVNKLGILRVELLNLNNNKNVAETELNEVLVAEAQLGLYNGIIDLFEKQQKSEETLKERRDKLTYEIEENDKKIKEYNVFLSSKPVCDSSSYTWKINKLEESLKEASHIETCPSGSLCPYVKRGQDGMIKIATELNEIKTEFELKKKEVENWEVLKNSIKEPTDNSILNAELINVNKELNDVINYKMSLIEKKAKKEALDSLVNTKGAKIITRDKLDFEIANAEREYSEISENIKGLDGVNFQSEIKILRSKLEDETSKLSRYESMLESIKTDEIELANEQKKIDKIEKEELPVISEKTRKVKLVKEAFGSHGLKTVVIDYMIPQLEDNINEILSRLSEFRVRLDTQTEKSSGDGAKEGLFITIINDLGEELPFANYSGGERLKVTVAISEALANLQKVNFRVFDEVFIGLDANSTDNFAMILERLQTKFSQVLCISHLQSIKDLFDKKIICVKNNGITTIS